MTNTTTRSFFSILIVLLLAAGCNSERNPQPSDAPEFTNRTEAQAYIDDLGCTELREQTFYAGDPVVFDHKPDGSIDVKSTKNVTYYRPCASNWEWYKLYVKKHDLLR